VLLFPAGKIELCAGGGCLSGRSLPVLIAAPELVMTRVFGYSSQPGPWGLSLLALVSLRSPHLAWVYDLHARYGKLLSLCLVLGASLWPRPRSGRNALFMQAGFLMFLFVSLTPGFVRIPGLPCRWRPRPADRHLLSCRHGFPVCLLHGRGGRVPLVSCQ
jgi:hypothetical protein